MLDCGLHECASCGVLIPVEEDTCRWCYVLFLRQLADAVARAQRRQKRRRRALAWAGMALSVGALAGLEWMLWWNWR